MQLRTSLAVIAARLRMPVLIVGVLAVVTSRLHGSSWVSWGGAVLVGVSVVSTFVGGLKVRRDAIPVVSPVRGRWVAVNSPADKVPSHGVHSAGQTYAIDLVYWPDPEQTWQGVHRWPLMQRPREFPGFGQPVFAPSDGRVVKVRSGWRDHWSRNSWPALAFAFVEGSLRELLGPGALLGNHVIVDLGDGTYAALAHLKHGSVTVAAGETIEAGQQLAECGNSGNTTEPHLHFQLMDAQRPSIAAGLPFSLVNLDVPKNGEALVATGPALGC